MAVNLSPIWGAGAQLLDNSGNVLSGGKIYTYAAGTTTQVTTYTSNTGVTANSNPIILNSAGRVPYEIWLTDGQNYKFVLKDSNDVLIGTWDNLSGINSNFVAYTNQQEIQTATAGQTVFNLTTMQYLPGTNSLSVFVDGVNQYGPGAQYAFTETDQTTVTFASGLHVGAEVKFTSTQTQNAGAVDASQVSYTPPFTNSVTTNVETKLAQYVSVKDFGAAGDGVTDDSVAFVNAVATGKSVYLPAGSYVLNDSLVLAKGQNFFGEGRNLVTIKVPNAFNNALVIIQQGCSVYDMTFTRVTPGNLTNTGTAIQVSNAVSDPFNTSIKNVGINFFQNGIYINNYRHYIENVQVYACGYGAVVAYDTTKYAGTTTFINCGFLYNTAGGIWVRSTGNHVRVTSCTFEGPSGAAIICDGGVYIDSCYIADKVAWSVIGNGTAFIENGLAAPLSAGSQNYGQALGYNFLTTDDEYCLSGGSKIVKNATMYIEYQVINGQTIRSAVLGAGKYTLENCYFKNNVADPGSPSRFYALYPMEYSSTIPQQIMDTSTQLENYVTNGTFLNRSAVISNFVSTGNPNPWGGDIKRVNGGSNCQIAFSIPTTSYTVGDPLLLMIYVKSVTDGGLRLDFANSTNIAIDNTNYQDLVQYASIAATNVYNLNVGHTYGSKESYALNSFIVTASSNTGTIYINGTSSVVGEIAAIILTPIKFDPSNGRPIGWFYNP